MKILIFLSTLLFSMIPLASKAETVLEEINRTGIIKLGIRTDSPPFGYTDRDENLRGICLYFFSAVISEVKRELNRQSLTVQIVESNIENRFRLVENNIVNLECGPNTIRETTVNITFSKYFFITGTYFLVKPEEVKNFNTETTLEDKTIGVLRFSTTEEYINSRYPSAEIVLFQGQTGRTRGIQALSQGRIDAIVSDGILLLGEMILLSGNASQVNYELIPENPISCDYYGMILPKNDPQWENLINSVIERKGNLEQISQEWLGLLQEHITSVYNYCQENKR